jgi:CRISPR system Cascade subunit CasB
MDEKMKIENEKFLEKLKKIDSGERASLKKSAGKRLDDANTKSITSFYKLIQNINIKNYHENEYFILSTLYSLKKDRNESLETSLGKALKNAKETESLDMRFNSLLDSDKKSSEFARKLSNMIKYLDNKGINIDWGELLEDILAFNHKNATIKKKWAREYYL